MGRTGTGCGRLTSSALAGGDFRDSVFGVSLHTGLSASFEIEVGDADTALAVGSGDLEVLGTPRVVALLEGATVRAVAEQLAPGETTVGVEVVVRHLRASTVGARIAVAAELAEVDGRQLGFRVTAHEEGNLVAEGTVRRAIVERERFMRRVAGRS